MYFNPVPELIRRFRKKRKLSQTVLGEKLGVVRQRTVRQAKVSNWETGKLRPSREEEQQIFEVLNVTDAEYGAEMVEMVAKRFNYDLRGGAPASPPLLSKVEDLLGRLPDALPPEEVVDWEEEVLSAREREGALKRTVWRLEKKMEKELRKAGNRTGESD